MCTLAVATCLSGTEVRAETAGTERVAWKLEQNSTPARYAVVEPTRTNLDVASVVLACENASDRNVLQLQLYPTNEGPLLPKGANPPQLKTAPRAEVEIDGKIFPASLLFGDDHAVLADGEVGGFAGLSEPLVDAMAKGKTMTLRLDLLAEPPGTKASFDGAAVIELRANGGRAAIGAMQQCVSPIKNRTVGLTR
ncbi:hypothetical protein [Reyranella soli]|uniref:Uncharacterized protein n=1 Tax=Reyranella soli TaxID=1230389 RepID=A0A512N8J2_9HYPH|nr:hypothetical protein [Reyranella soli]GEP55296.1 hypothetical protein RSO01_24620 [Reyranella soli]